MSLLIFDAMRETSRHNTVIGTGRNVAIAGGVHQFKVVGEPKTGRINISFISATNRSWIVNETSCCASTPISSWCLLIG
jgi:hypothetical protein